MTLTITTGLLLSTIGILISLMIIILTRMVSGFFGLSNLKGWSDNELRELVYTILIVALGMIVVQYVINSLALSILGIPGSPADLTDPPYFTFAELTLDSMRSVTKNYHLMSMLFETQGLVSLLSGMGLTFPAIPIPTKVGMFLISFSFTPFAGLSPISDTITFINKMWVLNQIILYMQSAFLSFVKETAFTIFFPIGVILRTFPFTRKAGSTLIALAVSFYFGFPLMVILSGYFFDHMVFLPVVYTSEPPPDMDTMLNDILNYTGEETIYQDLLNQTYQAEPDITGNEEYWTNLEPTVNEPDYEEAGGSIVKRVYEWMSNQTRNLVGWFTSVISEKVFGLGGDDFKLRDLFDSVLSVMGKKDYPVFVLGFVMRAYSYSFFYLMFSFIMFVINFTVCITLFETLSTILGGEKSLFALGRIKKMKV